MNLLSKSVIAAGALLMAVPAVAATPKLAPVTTQNGMITQNGQASDLFPGLKAFLNLPAASRSQVDVYYTLRIKHCDASLVRIIMTDKGRAIPLRLLADGRVTPMPTREQMNAGATVSTVRPQACGVAPKIKVFSPQPDGKVYDAVGLATGIKQGNTAMGKIAGVMAFSLAKLDRVYFIGGGDGVAIMANGQQKALLHTGAGGEYPAGTPYYVPAQMGGAMRIQLNGNVSTAMFDTPPK